MSEEEFRKDLRHAKKRKRLGPKPYCANCGEADIRTLQRSGGEILCADCRLLAQGKRPFEKHHPAKRRNDAFTVELPANEHAIYNDMQYDWPDRTRMNRDKSPLLRTAASRRAAHDTLARQAEVLEEMALVDEALDRYLKMKLGENWVEGFKEHCEKAGT